MASNKTNKIVKRVEKKAQPVQATSADGKVKKITRETVDSKNAVFGKHVPEGTTNEAFYVRSKASNLFVGSLVTPNKEIVLSNSDVVLSVDETRALIEVLTRHVHMAELVLSAKKVKSKTVKEADASAERAMEKAKKSVKSAESAESPTKKSKKEKFKTSKVWFDNKKNKDEPAKADVSDKKSKKDKKKNKK